MQVTAIIPARFASTRFPGKPLAPLLGKPMIQWVYERTGRSRLVDRVLVATDDLRIAETVRGFGGEAVMTRSDHPSGTDRLAEVAGRLKSDIVVNVQGDEPLIEPAMIDCAVAPLAADAGIPMGTLKSPVENWEDYHNPNVVKVVTDGLGFALYFSRAPIPHRRDGDGGSSLAALSAYRHIGLYVYRRKFLLTFAGLAPTLLEQTEKLEQLRALEHGYRIRVVETTLASHGVDTPEDLARVEALMRREGF
ncbi:MAG: 3-deoxy-manno-octulosonate cytidylyltransferase [Deltaproteobacteria bacterium]|nr:3-deoxy-manno-octulosonate cytidylyltransferase [Deltaproteobacteria bacterium]